MEGSTAKAGGEVVSGNGRAALYLRVSTEEQVEHGLSLAMQEEICRKGALAAGASAVEVFRDDGYSGMKLQRPALQELLSRLEDFDLLCVWKVDRLCRKLKDRLALLDRFVEAGVRFVSATEHIDLDSVMGRAAVQLMGIFSEVEVGLLRERIAAAQRHRATVLNLPHGVPPYGYRYPGGNQPLQVDPQEAAYVVEMFRRYAAGSGLQKISVWLNGTDAPLKRRGRQWWPNVVRQILENPAYLGEHRFHGERFPSDHPPLIEEDLWNQVQERLQCHTKIRPQGRGSTSLTPILRCGLCIEKDPTKPSGISRSGPREAACYVCRSWSSQPKDSRHESVSVTARKLEAVLWHGVNYLAEPGHYEQALKLVAQRRAKRPQAQAWEKRLVEIDRQMEYNLRAARAGAVDVEVLARTNAPLLEEKARLREKLQQAADAPGQEAALETLKERSVQAMLKKLEGLPVDRQLVFLGKLFLHVELWPGHLRCVFLHPDLPAMICPIPKFYAPSRGCDKIADPYLEK